TDEIKEHPFVMDADPRYPKTEVYHSDLFGNDIDRLTHSSGFDSEMIFVPLKKQVLFTSTRGGIPGVYWLDLRTNAVLPFQFNKERPQRSPSLASDGKTLFWIEEDLIDKTQNIVTASVLGKNRAVVRNLKGIIHNVVFSPKNQLIYSWIPEGAEFSQVDLYDETKPCTQTLLKHKLHFSEMQFSVKNPNLMLFRVADSDSSQVYRWELPVDLGPCNEGSPSDTLKK
ncbi:MAG TPA: hypothetical protein VIG33_00035, partial [Pseudobdellovibrionaceae bacterium]